MAVVPDFVWPAPSGGWVDAWNGWYPDLNMALRDAPAGVGSPWVLSPGEDIITSEEAESRMLDR